MKTLQEIQEDYESRYQFKLDSKLTEFYSKSGELVAIGFECIVYGQRGGYLQFNSNQLVSKCIILPQEETWRLHNENVYYLEYRTKLDNVKIYLQKRKVNYADYKINKYYISPFDLYNEDGLQLIISKKNSNV